MKRILILIHVLFCGYICPLLAEDTGAARYQDSILKVADALPATLVRLTYLRDMAYKHQYAPYILTFQSYALLKIKKYRMLRDVMYILILISL